MGLLLSYNDAILGHNSNNFIVNSEAISYTQLPKLITVESLYGAGYTLGGNYNKAFICCYNNSNPPKSYVIMSDRLNYYTVINDIYVSSNASFFRSYLVGNQSTLSYCVGLYNNTIVNNNSQLIDDIGITCINSNYAIIYYEFLLKISDGRSAESFLRDWTEESLSKLHWSIFNWSVASPEVVVDLNHNFVVGNNGPYTGNISLHVIGIHLNSNSNTNFIDYSIDQTVSGSGNLPSGASTFEIINTVNLNVSYSGKTIKFRFYILTGNYDQYSKKYINIKAGFKLKNMINPSTPHDKLYKENVLYVLQQTRTPWNYNQTIPSYNASTGNTILTYNTGPIHMYIPYDVECDVEIYVQKFILNAIPLIDNDTNYVLYDTVHVNAVSGTQSQQTLCVIDGISNIPNQSTQYRARYGLTYVRS